MTKKKEGKFELKRKTPFSEIASDTILPESDLCFQDDECIYQFSYTEGDSSGKTEIAPGIFSLSYVNSRVKPKDIELRSNDILKSITNSKSIVDEANTFFNNLDVYEKLGEPKSRKILIYSDPGMGKTATITDFCNTARREDEGTVVLVWPTSSIESSDILDFLSKNSEYTKECSRLILIMEDIGGGEREGSHSSRAVDSAMLDILDGIGVTFKLPTLIIATTNYPQNLLSALADRPGRFDLMLKLDPPNYDERLKIVEFIAKRELTDDEKLALKKKQVDEFSIAHLKEVVIRSMLHKKTIAVVVDELIKHKETFKNAFDDKADRLGF